MTRDEMREIAKIVGDDEKYYHFVKRINKEFDLSDDDRNSKVYVVFVEDSLGERVGFAVIGYSPVKMRVWEKTFKEEGWVDPKNFTIDGEYTFELMYMYIKPELRRNGFGDQLFDKIMGFGRDMGIHEIYAYVSDTSSHALDFYKQKSADTIQDFSDEDTSAAFVKWTL